MKNKIKAGLVIASVFFSGLSIAREDATIVQYENDCKYYIVKTGSGHHVIGAINHNPPSKETTINGEFTKTGYQDMTISTTPIYMDVVSVGTSLDEAKKELNFKCMETR